MHTLFCEKKQDNHLDFIIKARYEYEQIIFMLNNSINIKRTMLYIYFHFLKDVNDYKDITHIYPENFFWINYIVDNRVSKSDLNWFCNAMTSLLLVKYSVEKILENSYKNIVI